MNRRLKAALSCLVLCAALAGMLSTPAAAADFRDVPASHWASDSIRRCVDLGYFQGKSATSFGLGEKMTRSAFTVVLCRFFGWETSTPAAAIYEDVPADVWYADEVAAAYEHGAITRQQSTFRPSEPITREELTVMLVRAMGYGAIAGLSQDMTHPFRDVTTNAGYITMAYDLGLVNGTSADTFSPGSTASREQVAVILMRLYDKLHAPSAQTVAAVSSVEELAGLDVAAIPAGKLMYLRGAPTVTVTMARETAASILAAAKEDGVQALLHLTGGTTALNGDPAATAAVAAEAVTSGGYDGLFLDIPALGAKKEKAMTQLVQALDTALGDRPLYVVAEAPSRAGQNYAGYDYAALGAAADHLVLRLPAVQDTSSAIPTAPVAPLEEIYYALGTVNGSVEAGKLTLMLSTTPTAWVGKKAYDLAEGELETLLTDKNTGLHYSARYACAYLTALTPQKKALTVWYLDQEAIAARLQLAKLAGIGQLCLEDWPHLPEGLPALLQ